MSSSSVCQGLQSCLEPRIIEPRVLRMKLAPPKSNFSRSVVAVPSPNFTTHPDNLKIESHIEENNTILTANTENKKSCAEDDGCDVKSQRNVDDDVRGWSFLQFLSNTSNEKNNKQTTTEMEKAYVHPLVKRSASTLSDKSLEMCTESLGSETGSEVSESSDDTSLVSLETETYTARSDPPKPRETSVTRRTMNRSLSFPPPLTSISGSKGVQVRPHREGGRLVLEAVTVTTSHTYFHAERSDGRLRLCMMKMDNEDDQAEEEDGVEEEEEALIDHVYDDGEEQVKDGEDIEGINEKVRGEMGVKKVTMLSRCKEGGCASNGILKCDSLWVVTST